MGGLYFLYPKKDKNKVYCYLAIGLPIDPVIVTLGVLIVNLRGRLMDIKYILIMGALLIALYFWYASIISKRNKALEALSGVDVQLKKRSNLIPNILTIAKKYMEHEKTLLEEITQLRGRGDEPYDLKNSDAVKEHLSTASLLSGKMSKFMLSVENYPDLKASETMLQAQQTYNECEEHIAAARRFYNSSVTSIRNAIQVFPGNVIASIAGVSDMPFFEADEPAKKPVNALDHL